MWWCGVWLGKARLGADGLGTAGFGAVGQGKGFLLMRRHKKKIFCDKVWWGGKNEVGLGMVRRGTAMQGYARRGRVGFLFDANGMR